MLRLQALLFVLIIGSGCELAGGGGGTGGGAGGGGATMQSFTRGYVFVRKDDRNVYIADEKDLQARARLSSTGGASHPSLSKDGKRVVYAQQDGLGSFIATVAVTGGAMTTVLSSSPQVKNLRSPVFTKDGARILFAYDVGAGTSVGIVNVDGTAFKQLAGGSLSYASPSLSADGLTFLAGAGNSASSLTQLERVEVATGMATNLLNGLGLEAQVIVNRVVLSPDGTKAAFDGRVSSGSSRIFVVNLTTKTVTKLTDYPGDPNANDSFPTWVGNDKVGFSSDTGGNDQVYVLPATATNTSGGLTLPGAVEASYGP